MNEANDNTPKQADQFHSTRWSVVLKAVQDPSTPIAREALATLCQTYWYPLFAYVRRQGVDFTLAQDLTQGFFASLLEGTSLKTIDPEKGRFRSFLLAACKKYVASQRRANLAQKRGGGQSVLSLDFAAAEERYQLEPTHEITAEQLFERNWAVTLLNGVVDDLRDEYNAAGKAALFDALKDHLQGENQLSYPKLSERLGMSESAMKSAAHKLRQRFRERLNQRISDTVVSEDDVVSEIQALFRNLNTNSR